MAEGSNSYHPLSGGTATEKALSQEPGGAGQPDGMLSTARLTIAMAWINARTARDRSFDMDLFADPAWDILLDLYVNLCRDRAVSISDLYTACSTPPTTTLRWITILEKHELVSRRSDPTDRRRRYISLTAMAIDKMERTLDKAMESDKKLGLSRLTILETRGHN